jgi:hypothetical protein
MRTSSAAFLRTKRSLMTRSRKVQVALSLMSLSHLARMFNPWMRSERRAVAVATDGPPGFAPRWPHIALTGRRSLSDRCQTRRRRSLLLFDSLCRSFLCSHPPLLFCAGSFISAPSSPGDDASRQYKPPATNKALKEVL